jgi:hypothetical protein
MRMSRIETTTLRGARRAVAAAGLPIALALALVACPPQEDLPPPPDAPAAEPANDSPDDEESLTLAAGCTNREFGFQVRYPEGWVVNQANGLPPCSAFDPADAAMPAAGEIPRDIAIVIHRDQVPFERTTDFDADPTVQAVSRETATIDGRRAVVAELQHTGAGMYPEGGRQYGYYVDLDGFTLMATTHGIDDADPPPYQERQRILDDMMASLRFQDPR